MKRRALGPLALLAFAVLAVSALAVSTSACIEGDGDDLNAGGRGLRGAGEPCTSPSQCASDVCTDGVCVGNGVNGDDPNAAPGALQCTVKPQGRSYVQFDGAKLENTRTNENVGVNRARIKPFGVLKGEYQRVLGIVPPTLEASGGSFEAAPARWYAEAQHSGVSLNAIFDISFEGCSSLTKTASEYAAPPTRESAANICSSLIRKAWSHSASPAELASCTSLAVDKLTTEPDARKRWTYVCASILSSSQFLTF